MTLRLELRSVLYYEEGADNRDSFRGQLMTEIGLSFFIPTVFREEG